MTNQPPFPPAGPVGGPTDTRGCPDAETMARYLDGELDATGRASVEDHASRCEDCYFAVMETSLMSAEGGAEGPGLGGLEAPGGGAIAGDREVNRSPVPTAPGRTRPRTLVMTRHLLTIAATLTMIAGSIALWRLARPTEMYADPIQPLVEAVGNRRFFEPRLAGGFKYGPRLEARRASEVGPASGAWAALGLAKEMRSGGVPASKEARAARAAAALFLGEVDEAVVEFADLVEAEPEKAAWACNLAAALLVRAATIPANAAGDLQGALRYADQAARLNPGLVEARFNRGIALEALGRTSDAQQAFAEVVAYGDSWSEAAREHLTELDVGPKGRN